MSCDIVRLPEHKEKESKHFKGYLGHRLIVYYTFDRFSETTIYGDNHKKGRAKKNPCLECLVINI